MNVHSPEGRHLARLTSELDELREENRQLRDLLAMETIRPTRWGLIPIEAKILSLLLTRGQLTADLLANTVYRGRDIDFVDRVKTLVCRIRKKLPPEIRIVTVWGEGYVMPKTSREALTALLAQED